MNIIKPILFNNRQSNIIDLISRDKKKLIICVKNNEQINELSSIINDKYKIKPLIINNISDIKDDQMYIANIGIVQSFETSDIRFLSDTKLLTGSDSSRKKESDLLIKVIKELQNFNIGDYVIHKKYGLGRFLGTEIINSGGMSHDYIKLEYANTNKLMIPIEDISCISKYKGSNELGDENEVSLDTLTTDGWQQKRARIKSKIQALAHKILSIEAKRRSMTADKFEIDKTREFIDLFYESCNFTETEDQLKATIDIESDLSSGEKPMNRLICGDVGFGKTEIAIRAAFIASCGKQKNLPYGQVAIVCPTTFLAQQHFELLKNRFEAFSVKVGLLSRHIKTGEIQDVHDKITLGEIDIIAGTHALFSDNVQFKKLSLIIIDEEQSFGVEQKEKMKTMWPNAHMLYMSATPIPRTLQSSLHGMLDTSLISIPPVDRKPVKTYIMPLRHDVIINAINNELSRNGKVLIITPRIEDIASLEAMLESFRIKDLKSVVIHGRLSKEKAKKIMHDIEDGKYNIVISTTILAQGVNIPLLNTIVVNNADMFGLGQLYQIRGRVGRAERQGYAYFIVDDRKIKNEKIIQRLNVLESFTDLGSGFSIAAHDLEMRGGGNVLGKEQAGNIKEIGMDLYYEMLDNELKALNDQSLSNNDDFIPNINIGYSVCIPDKYISDPALRIEFYRRISSVKTKEDWILLKIEMIDRFGTIPEEIDNLVYIIMTKELCYKYNINKVSINKINILLEFREKNNINGKSVLKMISEKKIILTGNTSFMLKKSSDKLDDNLLTIQMICKEIII